MTKAICQIHKWKNCFNLVFFFLRFSFCLKQSLNLFIYLKVYILNIYIYERVASTFYIYIYLYIYKQIQIFKSIYYSLGFLKV